MKTTFVSTCLLSLAVTGSALAHSPVKETSPANEAVLEAVPDMLHMTFAAPARVMKVTMTHSKGDATHESRLEIPTRDTVEEIHLTPEFMGSGNYLVEWRALGGDGHVLKGTFSFQVTGE